MSSHPSISTGTEREFWIAVGSRLRMVEERHHVTAWNHFYPVFITPLKIKNITEQAELFSPSSYIRYIWHPLCYRRLSINLLTLLAAQQWVIKGNIQTITWHEDADGERWMGVRGQRHSPATLPPGITRHLVYRWLCGPQDRSEQGRKNSPAMGFDPRTVQSIHWATGALFVHDACLLSSVRK